MFDGLNMNLGNLCRLSDAKTFSISAENMTGEKGKGAVGEKGTCAYLARELGEGWKCSPCISLPVCRETTIADIEGSGAVQSMWFAGDITNWFTIIRIYWDDQEIPSVEAPLTAFFGLVYNDIKNSFTGTFPVLNSIPVTVAPKRGFNCFWEMPFRKRCRITVENISSAEKSCFYQINYTLTEVPEDAAYFHAQYRQAKPVKDGVFTILDGVSGKGHYVGTALSVGLNGEGGWWGEGEVKFYLDGDSKYPSICGTGTEDYFGGAFNWDVYGKYNTYSTPFLGMFNTASPDGLYMSQQHFSMYRWHIMDPIRFEADIKVTIQDLGWKSDSRFLKRRDDMMSVAFWYQTLPTSPFAPLPSNNELEIS